MSELFELSTRLGDLYPTDTASGGLADIGEATYHGFAGVTVTDSFGVSTLVADATFNVDFATETVGGSLERWQSSAGAIGTGSVDLVPTPYDPGTAGNPFSGTVNGDIAFAGDVFSANGTYSGTFKGETGEALDVDLVGGLTSFFFPDEAISFIGSTEAERQ